jgi:D-galactarolactone cycloisomerase
VLNPFRDLLGHRLPYALDDKGCVTPLDGVGIGMTINTDFIADHPLIDGPCYV